MNKKVLHISFSDKSGGAAIAAYRHNEALNLIGYDSKMLVVNKKSCDSKVLCPTGNKAIVKLKSIVYPALASRKVMRYNPYATHSIPVTGFDLAKERIVNDSDVIVLHWINNGMVSLNGVEQLLGLGKPVIWFLHDMWPMTGGCHYSLGCDRYETECHNCPMLFNRKGSDKRKDISYRILKKKIEKWSEYANLRILAPSRWLAECASRSAVFNGIEVNVLRNVINTDIFKPLNREFARHALNLPLNKKLVLFGADSINSPYKGWIYLKKALENMTDNDVECVVFGNSDTTSVSLDSSININYVGRMNDDIALTMLYNACDIFVTPSIADNYPNVILEAMSCGLPCVGFNIGGIPEMVRHKSTGYISSDLSYEGLLDGINWILHDSDYSSLSNKARTWVIDNSSYRSLEKSLILIKQN